MSKHKKRRKYEQERNYMNPRGIVGSYPYNNMNNAMNGNINGSINGDLNTNMNAGMNNNMNAGMSSNMNNGMNNNMNNGMNNNMNNGMNNGMNGNMNNNMSSGMESNVPFNNVRPNNMMGNFMNSINGLTGLHNNNNNSGNNSAMNGGSNINTASPINNILQSLSGNPILQMLTNLDFNLLSKILFGSKTGTSKMNNGNSAGKEPIDIQNNLRDILKNLDDGEIANLIKHVAPEEVSYIISKLNISKDLNSNFKNNLDHVINNDFNGESEEYSDDEKVWQSSHPASAILEVINKLINRDNKEFIDKVMNLYSAQYVEPYNSIKEEPIDTPLNEEPIEISEENIVDIEDPLEDYSLSS